MLRKRRYRSTLRRGTTIIHVAASAVTLIGFAALAVDVGNMFGAEGELQRAADSAALAGSSGIVSLDGVTQDNDAVTASSEARAQYYSNLNQTLSSGTILDLGDIVVGNYDFDNPGGALDTSGLSRFNAVQVTVNKTPGSSNGGIPFYLASFLGITQGGATSTATAVFDDRFAGFDPADPGAVPLLPFTKIVTEYDPLAEAGQQVVLYPNSNGNGNGNGGGEIPGNFGELDFRGNSTPAMRDLISTGVLAADLQANLGVSELTYVDDFGAPVEYTIEGTPGMRATLETEISAYTGQIVGFFVHSSATENGNNATYQNVGIRFARLVLVELNGNPKELIVQPLPYNGGGVIVSEDAPSSNGLIGRIMLVE